MHQGEVNGIAMTRDARLVATAGKDGVVRLWDVPGRRPLRMLKGHGGPVNGVAFSPDGSTLVSAASDGTVRLWDVATGATVRGFRKRFASMHSVAFLDGRLVVASSGGTDALFSWEALSGLPRQRAPLLLLAPEPLLLTHEGLVRLGSGGLRRGERRPVEEVPKGLREFVSAAQERAVLASVSADGRRAVMTTADDTVELWDLVTGKRLATGVAQEVEALRFAGPGFVTLAAGRVVLWRCDTGSCQPSTLVEAGATAVATGGGEILVAVGPALQAFSVTGTQGRSHPIAPGATALLYTSGHLVAGFLDGSIEARPRGRPGKAVRLADTVARPVTMLAEGPLGIVAAGHANGAVGVWSLADGRLLDQGKLHGPIAHLAIQDGRLYAASEVCDHLTWNLDGLRRPYCDLLAEVWAQVAVVWTGERPVRRAPPPSHACAARGGRR